MVVLAIGLAWLVLTGFIVGRWAWHYQRHGAELGPRGLVGPAPSTRVTISCSDELAVAAGCMPERVTPDMVGWKHLRLLGVLADGNTVLLACRRQTARLARRAHGLSLASLAPDDRTIVLVVGEDQNDALALLEQWRDEGVSLRIRIESGPSAVELSDEGGRAVRAPLVAA